MKIFKLSGAACLILMAALALQTAGCQKADNSARNQPQGGQPAGGAPMAGGDPHGGAPMGGADPHGGMPMGGGSMSGPGMKDAEGPTDGQAVALTLTGISSAEELKREQAKLSDAALQSTFDAAFRMTFSAKQAQRNYPEAIQLVNQVITAQPNFAPAYRVLGYAKFNTGDPSGAVESYRKAVQLDPGYGEAEYALAFMYAMSDKTEGLIHYKRAMELGVKDERDIGATFYGLPSQK